MNSFFRLTGHTASSLLGRIRPHLRTPSIISPGVLLGSSFNTSFEGGISLGGRNITVRSHSNILTQVTISFVRRRSLRCTRFWRSNCHHPYLLLVHPYVFLWQMAQPHSLNSLQYPKNGTIAEDTIQSWWGNTVFLDTADYLGTPLKQLGNGVTRFG